MSGSLPWPSLQAKDEIELPAEGRRSFPRCVNNTREHTTGEA